MARTSISAEAKTVGKKRALSRCCRVVMPPEPEPEIARDSQRVRVSEFLVATTLWGSMGPAGPQPSAANRSGLREARPRGFRFSALVTGAPPRPRRAESFGSPASPMPSAHLCRSVHCSSPGARQACLKHCRSCCSLRSGSSAELELSRTQQQSPQPALRSLCFLVKFQGYVATSHDLR